MTEDPTRRKPDLEKEQSHDKDRDGPRPRDVVKYGPGGKFTAVLATLNPKFTAGQIANTKGIWDTYVASLSAVDRTHSFGGFAAVLLKDDLATQGYPSLKEWIADCKTYNGNPIDGVALSSMANALIDNLQSPNPYPMSFSVKLSTTGMHEVEQQSGNVAGARGILVTMYCPH